MKKCLALLLAAVLLLSAAPSVAFAIEYTDTYETALNLAKNDLTDLDNLNDAVMMLSRLGSFSFSRRYVLYFRELINIQGEDPDLETAELMFDLCQSDVKFTEDLEERSLPSCSDILSYIEARKQEEAGNLRAACEAYSRMSFLDATDRAAELVLLFADTSEPRGHDWDSPEYRWSTDYSSCTASRVCVNCGLEESETVTAGSTVTKQGSCTAAGETIWTARFTNSAFEPQTEAVPAAAAGHNWTSPEYRWTPDHGSCTASRVCVNCGLEESETVTAGSTVTRQATCTDAGEIAWTARFANRAFDQRTETVQVAAAGHNWIAATCSTPETCSRCGLTKGTTVSHQWTAGTDSSPKRCRNCGATAPSIYDIRVTQNNPKYPNKIVLPKDSSYLSEYETRYVKSQKGIMIYLFWAPNGGSEYRRNHDVREATPVTVIARENGFDCIVYTNEAGVTVCGWAVSSSLVLDYYR